MKQESTLKTLLGPLELKNPLLSASGTFGYGLELNAFCPPQALGMVITKGLSLSPRNGNPNPRMVETAAGLINSIGLENIGVEKFIASALAPLKATGALVGVNILGKTTEEYACLAARLATTEVDLVEVNVSCPNVQAGGFTFGSDLGFVAEITKAVAENLKGKPFMVKLSPLVSDIVAIARVAEENGATAVSLINTLPAMAVDLDSRRPRLANIVGGLSGPAVKPIALRQVWEVSRALKIPVVGMGGIATARDALEFILVGATAVQVGTATLIDPRTPLKIIDGLQQWMVREGLTNLDELRGTLKI